MKDLTKKQLEMIKRMFDMGVDEVSIGTKSISIEEWKALDDSDEYMDPCDFFED